MILILSDPEDVHLAPVQQHLARRSAPFRVYDPASFPLRSSAAICADEHRERATIVDGGGEIELGAVRSIWYRRPGEPQLAEGLEPEEAEWLRTETAHFLRGLWSTTEAVWVSPPQAIREASLKLVQLRAARALGFEVPAYLVTNDVARATAFLDAFPDGVVTKVLAKPGLLTAHGAAQMFTHLVTKEDRRQLESVRYGPTFLQRFIPKRMDVRVTVIGQRLFAVGMEAHGTTAASEDFRRADVFDLDHAPLELPSAVRDRCLRLVREMGLRFGALDLLLTDEGRYVFLEVNPNGQWLWLERMTGLPLSEAMADLLAEPLVQ